jgi:hypothetical protein
MASVFTVLVQLVAVPVSDRTVPTPDGVEATSLPALLKNAFIIGGIEWNRRPFG